MFSRIFQHFRHSKWSIKKIYADYATLTPISDGVLRVMVKAYKEYDKNPSALYSSAVNSKKRLETDRKIVAKALSGGSLNSVHSDEIFFTSGGTESNNIAIHGVLEAWSSSVENKDKVPHIVISTIEHPAVKKVVNDLVGKKRITATYVSITEKGIIDLDHLKKVFEEQKDIVLVSIMLVNNEIGTIQPLKDVSRMIRMYRKNNNSIYPYFHADACQAPCYVDIPIDKLGVDLLTLDGGKIYGPRGVGCLYVKRDTQIDSPYKGGDQESGIRPGTENVPAISGFSFALHEALDMREHEVKRLGQMQKYIISNLPENAYVNGSVEEGDRIVNNINICIPGSDSEFLVFKADVAGVEISAVTACQNSQVESRSTVVDALGKDCGGSSLRISLGRYTTWREVKKIVEVVKNICKISI